jgi:hypothetical protein
MSAERSGRPRSTRRRWLAAAVLGGAGWTSVGCTATVAPPESVRAPVTVHLLREAMHTGLVLPPPPGGGDYVEYGFGDWQWFALGNDAWHRVFATVLWPTQGTLGLRPFRASDDAALRRAAYWADLTPLVVERELVEALRRKLEARADGRRAEAVQRPSLGWTFVPDDESYWFPNTCADVVGAWCEELGCDVSWVPICSALAKR